METNLTEIIKKIRTAVLGREVRSSIADGLEYCGQISENAKADMDATAEAAKEAIDKTAEDAKNAIESNAASVKEQLSKDIDAKAAETLKTIPESYTELDGSVKQLKEDLSELYYNYKNYFNKKDVVYGKFVNLADSNVDYKNQILTNSEMAYIIMPVEIGKTYTITGLSYWIGYITKNDMVINHFGSDSKNLKNYTFTVNHDYADRLVINFKPNVYPPDTYMVVDGDKMYSNYYQYGNNFILKGNEIYAKRNGVYPSETTVYHVGAKRENSSLMELFSKLKNDVSDKIIYIDGGVYDIFDEVGGETFVNSITDSQSWEDVSVFIPQNTKIVGIGNVVLKFTPTAEQITPRASYLLSPLNGLGSYEIENITIIAENCRYCIHDESRNSHAYDGSIKKFKNVKCYKTYNPSIGYGTAFACGFNDKTSFYFYNCLFKSNSLPFSVHNYSKNVPSNNDSTHVYIDSCQFINTGDRVNYALRFGNLNYLQEDIKIDILNSYINKNIYLYAEASGVTRNSYEIMMCGCSDINVDVDSKLTTNPYVAQKYIIR